MRLIGDTQNVLSVCVCVNLYELTWSGLFDNDTYQEKKVLLSQCVTASRYSDSLRKCHADVLNA